MNIFINLQAGLIHNEWIDFKVFSDLITELRGRYFAATGESAANLLYITENLQAA